MVTLSPSVVISNACKIWLFLTVWSKPILGSEHRILIHILLVVQMTSNRETGYCSTKETFYKAFSAYLCIQTTFTTLTQILFKIKPRNTRAQNEHSLPENFNINDNGQSRGELSKSPRDHYTGEWVGKWTLTDNWRAGMNLWFCNVIFWWAADDVDCTLYSLRLFWFSGWYRVLEYWVFGFQIVIYVVFLFVWIPVKFSTCWLMDRGIYVVQTNMFRLL